MIKNPKLLDWCHAQLPASLQWLESLISMESPSGDQCGLATLMDALNHEFTRIGGAIDLLPNPEGAAHLRIRFEPHDPAHRPRTLILTHADTVWPHGTLHVMPFRVEGSVAYGPGILDMKASFVILAWALKAMHHVKLPLRSPLTILITSDEEIGSPDGRRWVEQEARHSGRVLVLEPAREDGSLKTARKGVGRFQIRVQGQAAHAGVAPEKGHNAIVELAHQILAINQLANPSQGTTLNVGTIQGGTATNVVPDAASLTLDARAWSAQESERLTTQLCSLRPVDPACSLEVTGGWTRPPMEKNPANTALFHQVRDLARGLGIELREGSTGGGSDGNFSSALGIPTLDGLGAEGNGAHSSHEHVVLDSIPLRAALLAHLLGHL